MSRNLRTLIAVAVVCLASSAASLADTKSHRKAAEDLLIVMGLDKQLQASVDQNLDLQIKANPQIAPFKEVMKKFFAKHMSWEALKDDLVTIYVDAFDEKELGQLKAFYLTPTGKKMVEKMPELMSKGMQLGAERVQSNQGELRQMIQEEAAKKK